MNPVLLGLALLLVGSLFYLLIRFLLRAIPRLQPASQAPPRPPIPLELSRHAEAVLIVQPGGRVIYLNQLAREWFNLWDEDPNLEYLAHRARPSEAFLRLCANEGQARLSLDGRFVEGTSYYAPSGDDHVVLVSLRRPQLGVGPDGSSPTSAADPGQAFSILNELNQAMTSNLDFEATCQAILEGVERVIPADFSEINVWKPAPESGTGLGDLRGYLVPYSLTGLPGTDRRLEKASQRYTPGLGYSGYLITHQIPLMVPDVDAYREVRPAVDRQQIPFRSYLGMPLLMAGEFIGTLELASLSKDHFSQGDLQILRILAAQAATGLHNALLYQTEQQRARELAGLANLAQAASAFRDPQNLFARLNESISPLLDVEVLGFLVYDENRHMLVGQIPFQGIPHDIAEWYRTTIQPGSPGEKLWQSAEIILSTQALEDPRLEALGLHHLAQVAGIDQTVLMPLASGGHMLGYLQVADKRDGSDFNADDLRLLAIIAGQAAPIIENSTLVQQSQRRAQRAETMRRIVSLTGSSATLEEILKYSVLDLARLLQADMAAIFLLDEDYGELRLHKGSLFGVAPEVAARLSRLPVDDDQFRLTVTGSQRQFLTGHLSQNTHVLPLYRPLVEGLCSEPVKGPRPEPVEGLRPEPAEGLRPEPAEGLRPEPAEGLQIESVIDVPLVMRDRGIGELMLGAFKPEFFNRSDMLSAAAAAGQLATAIEQVSLYSQTDENLRERVEQLTALKRVSRELNSTLDLEHLLERVYAEALSATHADCGTILLFDFNAPFDEKPGILLHLGDDSASELLPLEQIVLAEGASLVVDDFDDLPPNLRDKGEIYAAHAGIRSALIVPIGYQGQVAGLIHLHGEAPGRFDANAQEIGEALAVQAAIALGNAHRYQEQVRRSELLNRRVETLTHLLETAHALQAEQPLPQALESIAYAIQTASPFEIVLISVFDPQSGCLERMASAGIPLDTMAELRTHPQPWDCVRELLKPEFCMGRSYFIPYEGMPAVTAGLHTVTLLSLDGEPRLEDHWHPEDILLLPLSSAAGEPLGLISVDAPRDNLRPDRPTLETLEIFSGQAALIIENQRKVQALRNQLAGVQKELELAQVQITALMQLDQEQAIRIQHLSQRTRRLSAGMDIARVINRQTRREDILLALGREILDQMDLEVVLIAEPGPASRAAASGEPGTELGGLRLVKTVGKLPKRGLQTGSLPSSSLLTESLLAGKNPEALLGQRNPFRQSLQTGEILLVADLDKHPEWQNTPLLHSLEANSFICLPIPVEDRLDCAILAVSRSPLAPFTAEDEQLYDLLARQTATALQNLSLLAETNRRLLEVNLLRDFSRKLASLDPTSILHTLVESAIQVLPSAQAGMVALWDARQACLTPQAASGYASNDRLLEISFLPGEALAGQAFKANQPLRVDEVELARHYNLSPENQLRYRDATAGRPPVSSMAVPIAGTGGKSDGASRAAPYGVLVLDNFTVPAAFSTEDQALITSLAQQTALTLENAGLYQASEQRARQLEALTGVATSITSSLRPDELIATLLDQLQVILPYDTGTLWLIQGSRSPDGRGKKVRGQAPRQRMAVQAARGFADSEQRVGLTVAVEDSLLLNEMITTRQPISVDNVRADSRFPALMEHERLSWLGVPLVASGEVTGVIALEKTEPYFYSAEHIQIATTFASQAAVGLENATLYQESVRRALDLDQRSERLGMLNRLSVTLSHSLDATQILSSAIQEFLQVVNGTSASAILFDSSGQAILHADLQANLQTGSRPSSLDLPCPLPDSPLFARLRQSLGVFNCEDVRMEAELAPLHDFLERHATHSLLAVPLITGSDLHGLLLAHASRPTRFGPEEVELARTISNQVAIAIQNAQLFAQTRSLSEDLERRVEERTAELGREHHRTQTLLRILTELSASLDLDQVLNRTLLVLKESVDAAQITVLFVRPGEKKMQRLASVGYTEPVPSGGIPTPFSQDQGLAGWVISNRKPVLVADLLQDPRWIQLPQTPEPLHRSALAVPLLIGAESLGILLIYHHLPHHFSLDQLDLVQAAANQVAVALNNTELYRLIRDQAEDLGSMLRSQQIETSRSKAILEAVADGVLVTDANRQITLFNASAEKILNLDRSQVIGKSLEQFTGLFGGAAQPWRETIQDWSQNPKAYQPGDTFEERITLDNGRVVSVRLSPVSLRNERGSLSNFLGTVSIFRDITHQVEVDRLKSEFVATVSHELRTPMTSIKGYVEILLMGAAGQLSDQQKRFLEIVRSNAERLATLVNDLLDISRIESGRVMLTMQPLNMEELVEEAVTDLARHSLEENHPITIEKNIPPDLPRVFGDFERVRQVLDNLLDNAYHYNIPDGRITVSMRALADEVQVDVQDTGLGIPPQDQTHIFERFFRGESPLVLGVSGTGLGLSIVNNIVQMHHGRIWLESSGIQGEGSTFSFTLPIYKPQEGV